MKVSRLCTSILVIILVSLVSMPVGMNTATDTTSPGFTLSDSGEVSDVPYVWQEINGFCLPSALSMVLQGAGVDLSLYDILAASGSGFSMVSISTERSMTFYPGVMTRQIPSLEFFTDLYGLNLQFYLDSNTDYGLNAKIFVESLGCEVIDYAESVLTTPREIMRESIDAGYPLAINADTYYLPPVDWDIIRNYVGPLEPGGVGHAITIVSYNDTTQTVRVYDPGVGLMEPYAGYPDDGRWNYTMSYATLDDTWRSAGYVTFRVSNGTGKVADFEERLASYIAQRLIGNRTSYFQDFENRFFLGTGADAFRGMGLDMTLEAIRDYCTYFLEVDKPNAIRSLGHNLEVMMTMQTAAYRGSLNSLPDLLPSMDLQEFLDEASEALPHMDALSHNASITSGISVIPRDTILYNTFFEMASSFESSHDLDGAISEFSEELDEIAEHLFAIADAWKAAGETLSESLGESQVLPIEDLMIVLGGGATFLIIGVVVVFWRRRN